MAERREFLQSLVGAAALPVIKTVEAITLRPNDVLIVKIEYPFSDTEAQRVKDLFHEHLPNAHVIVTHGMDFAVIRRD
jgi:hypothetical protein